MGIFQDLVSGLSADKPVVSPKADLSAAVNAQQSSEQRKPVDLTEHLLQVGNAKAVQGVPKPGSLLG